MGPDFGRTWGSMGTFIFNVNRLPYQLGWKGGVDFEAVFRVDVEVPKLPDNGTRSVVLAA